MAQQEPPLFSPARVKTPEYWQCIRYIAPNYEENEWKVQDAIGAYCTLCKIKLNFSTTNPNSIKRHMNKVHAPLLEEYREKYPNSKKRNSNTAISPSFPNKRKVVMASSEPDTSANLAHLLPPRWKNIVQTWIEYDIPQFDYGGYVVGGMGVF